MPYLIQLQLLISAFRYRLRFNITWDFNKMQFPLFHFWNIVHVNINTTGFIPVIFLLFQHCRVLRKNQNNPMNTRTKQDRHTKLDEQIMNTLNVLFFFFNFYVNVDFYYWNCIGKIYYFPLCWCLELSALWHTLISIKAS